MDAALAAEGTAQEILSVSWLTILSLPTSIIGGTKSMHYSINFHRWHPQHMTHHRRHGCTERTREGILADLLAWATDASNTKIFWLNGMAGTGKTTITYSLSEILDKNLMLGSTFFCSRLEEDSRKVDLIFPTLAYRLARRFPAVCHALVDVLKNLEAGKRSMKFQFFDLIVTPVQAASKDSANRPVVVVIDAGRVC
jgi:hypothetical protein